MTNRSIKALRPASVLSAGIWISLVAHSAPLLAQSGWQCTAGPDGSWQCDGAVVSDAPLAPPPTRDVTPRSADAPRAATPSEPASAAPSTPAAPPVPQRPVAAAVSGNAAPAAWDWDWQPASLAAPAADAAAASCCAPGQVCDGRYVEPPADWADATQAPELMPTRVDAAESQWQGDTVTLGGGLVVTRGNTRLTAESGELDRSRNLVKLRGDVEIRQPGTVVRGTAADVTTGTGAGDIQNARYLDYRSGARVTADLFTRIDRDTMELAGASFTQCPPDNEDWQLRARHITLDQASGRGVARHTTLRVGPVPVLYTPYLNFPIDDRRQTGFLWPTIATSDGDLDVSVPLYINLAPNYDATLTPRHVGGRGAMLESELRYLNRNSDWRALGSFLPDDDEFGDDRWLGGLYQAGRFGPYVGTGIDFTRVSDHDYFEDLSLSSLELRRSTHLRQAAFADYYYDQWHASVLAEQHQVVDLFVAEPYRKLPQLTLERLGGGTNFRLDYSLYTELTAFDNRDAIDEGGPFVTGNRFYAEPGISFPMRWSAGYIEPEVRLRHVGYNLDDTVPGANDSPSATVPLGIIDAGMFFEREMSNGFVQTLEPRLYYLHSDFDDQSDQPLFDTSPITFNYQQLFSPRRFIGRDRLEDFNQLATGLTSRFINATGREVLSASIGQIIYFDDRQITLLNRTDDGERSRSNVAAQLNWQPNDTLWATANALWDPDRDLMEQGSFYIHHEAANGAIYNFGYRFRRETPAIVTLVDEINQLDIATAYPISDRWRLFARFNYDLNDQQSLENMFGVEYEDCCWRLRVIYQSAIDGEELDELGVPRGREDDVVMVEFQLKGLGSLGRKVGGLLQESIWGYRERE